MTDVQLVAADLAELVPWIAGAALPLACGWLVLWLRQNVWAPALGTAVLAVLAFAAAVAAMPAIVAGPAFVPGAVVGILMLIVLLTPRTPRGRP